MWSLRVLVETAVIAAMLLLSSYLGPWGVWPCALVIGTRLHGLAILGHVAAHRQAIENHLLNDIAGRAVFLLLGISLNRYRRFHGMHHAYLGETKDPEVEIVKTHFYKRWVFPYRWELSVCDALGLHSDELLEIGKRVISPISGIVYVCITIGIMLWSIPAGFAWLLAPATGFMFVHRLRAYTEHDHINLPGYTFRLEKPSLWRRMLYLPHNTWLHAEHHDAALGLMRMADTEFCSTIAEIETDTGRLYNP